MTVELDCSMGEGGGSVVRVSVALAAGQNNDIKLFNIRANRTKPGLRAQHIEAISAIKQFSGMTSQDLQVGKSQLALTKENNENDVAYVNIGTAGSIGLVAQAVMFYSFSQKRDLELIIKGGATHGKWAPSIEYIRHVTNEIVGKMNKNITVSPSRYGFFPRGGAEVSINFSSHDCLVPLTMVDRGELEKIEIYSTTSKSLAERNVAERQITSFRKGVNSRVDVIEHIQYVDSLSAGTGLTVVDHYSSGTRMGCFVPGERKLSSEKIGEMCALLWKKNSNSSASIDAYAADQLIVPMALTEGKSEITTTEITNHTRTNIELVRRFMKRNVSYEKEENCFRIIVS
ncbi:MAG: RNA 3'-terminal phosphate cyclase [Candidatus Heimdallarchaeota archaeon]|nr:RNA 3'-terminal phosphate cyclase [Candidatus Heimdallarchaeota archaeon]